MVVRKEGIGRIVKRDGVVFDETKGTVCQGGATFPHGSGAHKTLHGLTQGKASLVGDVGEVEVLRAMQSWPVWTTWPC
ncbi:hypothetical protein EBZ39_10535 [bacterium]|nr:hypothetical protein [bacterium]